MTEEPGSEIPVQNRHSDPPLPVRGSADLLPFATCRTRGALLAALAGMVITYTPADLMAVRGVMEREIKHIPASYREKLRPWMTEQVFGAYHRLLVMYREGMGQRLTSPLPDTFPEYCRMVHEALTSPEEGTSIRTKALYFILSAFTIFVLGEPGHPVGTPFPGGFTVERRNDRIYCPVRDREDEVPRAICRFCPALQTPGV